MSAASLGGPDNGSGSSSSTSENSGPGADAGAERAPPSTLSRMPQVFGGALHDGMWTKACLSYIRHLVGAWGKAGLASHVFGVRLTFPNDDFKLKTLQDELGAWGAGSESDGGDVDDKFVFQEVGDAQPLFDGAGSEIKQYLFFTLQDILPGSHRLNPGSRSFSEWDSIVIAPIAVRQLTLAKDSDRMHVLVVPEQQGKGFGQASDEFQILTAASWPAQIMWSMSLWDMKDVDYYDFGKRCPAEMRGATQEVMRTLLDGYRSRDECGHRVHLAVRADSQQQKLAALRHLLSIGMVELLAETDASTTWQLSAMGLKRLQVSIELTSPRRAFAPGGPPASEWDTAHVLVLHGLLAKHGWICKVRSGRQKEDESKTPYVKGGPLVFWISAKRATFSHPYFLLLLRVSTGIFDCAVPHLSSDEQYKCLLAGKEYVRRPRGTNKFHFGLTLEEAEAQEARKPRKRLKRTVGPRKKVRRALPPRPLATAVPSADEQADLDESRPSGSSDSSPSTSSSAAEMPVVGSPRPMSDAGKSSSSQKSGDPAPSAESLPKRSYKLTHVYDREDGHHKGLEATCACKDHMELNAAGRWMPCRKTLTFSSHGGVERTIRLLRWWQLQGPKYPTKEKHIKAPLVKEPPSLKQLEEMLAGQLVPAAELVRADV